MCIRDSLTGMGTSQNPTAAFKWANKAVANGEITLIKNSFLSLNKNAKDRC